VTPQSPFTIIAPVLADGEGSLRDLLASMNSTAGMADPNNRLVPFGDFKQLHFARFVLLQDPTLADVEAYDLPPPRLPVYLAFLGDCDGPARECLDDLARRASDGLRQIFAHCSDFVSGDELLSWMLRHNRPLAANYVNWVGRTVRQIREESALQQLLTASVNRAPPACADEVQQRRRELVQLVRAEIAAGRVTLTPPRPTPVGWRIAKLANAFVGVLTALIALPLLILLAPLLILRLRGLETRDPEICPRPDPDALLELQRLEDHDVTNQYTALGSVKPGVFRLLLVTGILTVIQFTCRHMFTRGYLARVQTIHFARWVFLDDKRRVLFASNYDGGHQAYMDDFINKVAWGLNIVFSNGIGWPYTDWLIRRGARREHCFKYFQRRHQLPTQVWYKAYPGLTLIELERNARIREGLERGRLSDTQASAWLELL
jgi:hypothetical protein